MKYFVYLLRCADDTLYCGITTDLLRRVEEHNDSAKGAAYTRSKRPVRLVYSEECTDRAAALRREYEIKQLPRRKKLELISAA
jgi:putative endonuclease